MATKEDILDAISEMTVIELFNFPARGTNNGRTTNISLMRETRLAFQCAKGAHTQ